MGFLIQLAACDSRVGRIAVERTESYNLWATLADQMATSQPLDVSIPNLPPGVHYTQVDLIYDEAAVSTADSKRTMIASLLLACEHTVPINKQERAQSKLIVAGPSLPSDLQHPLSARR